MKDFNSFEDAMNNSSFKEVIVNDSYILKLYNNIQIGKLMRSFNSLLNLIDIMLLSTFIYLTCSYISVVYMHMPHIKALLKVVQLMAFILIIFLICSLVRAHEDTKNIDYIKLFGELDESSATNKQDSNQDKIILE